MQITIIAITKVNLLSETKEAYARQAGNKKPTKQ